jgi:exopolysaccharide biosynthesis polyprenyl glycosylphosphotransferase
MPTLGSDRFLLQQTRRAEGAGLRVLDLAALAMALPLAYQAWRGLPGAVEGPPLLAVFWPGLAVALVLWGPVAWAHQLYDSERRDPARELRRLVSCFALVILAICAVAFACDFNALSRALTGLYSVTALIFLVGNRLGLQVAEWVVRRRGYHVRRYAVIGSGELAREVVNTMSAHPEWGFELVGHIAASRAPAIGRVLGSVHDLPRILGEHVIDEVIVALPHARMSAPGGPVEKAIQICEERGVAVRISLDVLRHSGSARMRVGDLDGLPMLCFTRTPSDALALAAKRAFDVAVAGFVLALMSPLLLVVAVAIRLDSPGPVFFRQRRVGLNGRDFTMMKFRSMRADAEQRLAGLKGENEASGPVFKMKHDPRITRVGQLLRKTSLDEFPQFINVLRGEMSVVGPRPPIRSEVVQYEPWQRRRLSVRPGITCTWQVSGRSDISFDRWMKLDLEYIDRWSFWRDFRICLQTVPAVLAARGAR